MGNREEDVSLEELRKAMLTFIDTTLLDERITK
jgi:hypothetical protein